MCCVCAGKLAAEGQQLEFIWDEGGIIYADGMPPLTSLPVALVAAAEKFYQVGWWCWHQCCSWAVDHIYFPFNCL